MRRKLSHEELSMLLSACDAGSWLQDAFNAIDCPGLLDVWVDLSWDSYDPCDLLRAPEKAGLA